MQPLPQWIKIYTPERNERLRVKNLFKLVTNSKLHTICQEALCPNRFECFSHGIVTFLILGDVCTRSCKFCYVKKGKPQEVDEEKPEKIARVIKKLNLKYSVITCVTRDDLKDGGAEIFAKTTREIRKELPECKIELLISDLQGNWKALEKIIAEKPDVLGHNLDTTRELHHEIKPQSDYQLSLDLLKKIKENNPEMKTKSGLMLGLGEEKEEVVETLQDLRKVEVNFLTLGQYLQPSERHTKVKKFYSLEEFKELKEIAYKVGFEDVASSPLVRSSYRADKLVEKID